MVEINNKTRVKIDEASVKEAVRIFLRCYKVGKKDVSIAFVGDIKIKALNKEYRGKNSVTDILAFPGEDNFLGELIIDLAQIRRQTKRFSPSFQDELIFILVHGLLHLVGYDDRSIKGKKKMIDLGKVFINEKLKPLKKNDKNKKII